MKRLENIYQVAKRLLGMIEPTGDSNIDKTRYANLEDTIDIVEKLTADIIHVARNKDAYERSVQEIGLRANDFITDMREVVTTDVTCTESQLIVLREKIRLIIDRTEIITLFNELLNDMNELK